jgi:cytochrome c-type biogenesis protein CcmH/NrfG
MKTVIAWSRKLIFPLLIIAAIIFVLRRDSGRMMKSNMQSQQSDKPFPAEEPKAPSRENVAKDFSQQLESLKRSVEKDPKNVSHLTMLATMLMDGHNPKEAIQYFERVRKIEPKNIPILLDLTLCYAETGNMSEALNVTNAILNTDPKNPTALYNKGAMYAQQGKMADAAEWWKKLIRVAPQSSEAKQAADGLNKIGKM